MADSRIWTRVLVGSLLVSAACSDGVADSTSSSEPAACGIATAVAELPPVLAEASGMARDPRRADLFWLHNDSGNLAELFAVDTAGRLLGSVSILGIGNQDPEDIAVARCGVEWCVYYADIGDNAAVRAQVLIHRLLLPPLPSGDGAPGVALSPEATYVVRYPGGPRDAEALVVDAGRGDLVIVSKGRDDAVEMFSATLADLEAAEGVVTLRRLGRLDLPIGGGSSQLVTAADLSGDATRLAIRSYEALYLYSWSGIATFDTLAMPQAASLVPALEPQGEGVAFASDPTSLYLASEGREGRPPQLSRIVCLR